MAILPNSSGCSFSDFGLDFSDGGLALGAGGLTTVVGAGAPTASLAFSFSTKVLKSVLSRGLCNGWITLSPPFGLSPAALLGELTSGADSLTFSVVAGS